MNGSSNENIFVLTDYGRLPELLELVNNRISFSVFVPREYTHYAAIARLINERFGSYSKSRWGSIRDSFAVGKDFSFFSLGFNNDAYRAEAAECDDGMIVHFRPS